MFLAPIHLLRRTATTPSHLHTIKFFLIYFLPVALAGVLNTLPIVDLGYEQHRASFLDVGYISFIDEISDLALTHTYTTSNQYNFSKIRYGQAPIGDLCFKAPLSPKGRNPKLQLGEVGRICPEAFPHWFRISEEFAANFSAGTGATFNLTAAEIGAKQHFDSTALKPDPRITEDCLFLDVVTPKAAFDNAQKYGRNSSLGAPVVIWIHGGGYVGGCKNHLGGVNLPTIPTTLIKSSQVADKQGIVFVSINYRLGALGWLGGASIVRAGGVANAGLYDQQLAIKWVVDHISLFGGDPSRIKLLGESAGAIVQSPGYWPIFDPDLAESATKQFLAVLNVSSVEESRTLDSATVIKANQLQINRSPNRYFGYDPTVDSLFVPDLPHILLSKGAHTKNVKVMTSYTNNEGPLLAPSIINSSTGLEFLIRILYPGVSVKSIDYIAEKLYPQVYDGSYPYHTSLERSDLVFADCLIHLSNNALSKALENKTYAYRFSIPPSVHGQDVAYTFYNHGDREVDPRAAETIQGYIANFVRSGNPNGFNLPYFAMQGKNYSMNNVGVNGTQTFVDPARGLAVDYWASGKIWDDILY
ncbi:Alpha/Beta hydrolase protein [Fusarium oxysporum Fo47]|nr:Alpha/Beta hydrolase protein [Fusarium oxysporum Fo47]QKD48700.2 Alpha/Beta hydrolase protein [Fusarium oxysporum Fo47]